MNQSRTAATNAIRRNAPFEIIVHDATRAVTHGPLNHRIKESIQAHGSENTVVVITKK